MQIVSLLIFEQRWLSVSSSRRAGLILQIFLYSLNSNLRGFSFTCAFVLTVSSTFLQPLRTRKIYPLMVLEPRSAAIYAPLCNTLCNTQILISFWFTFFFLVLIKMICLWNIYNVQKCLWDITCRRYLWDIHNVQKTPLRDS